MDNRRGSDLSSTPVPLPAQGRAALDQLRANLSRNRLPDRNTEHARQTGAQRAENSVAEAIESERFYYENLVHIPACSHFSPAQALLITQCEERAAVELLKHRCIRQVTMLEATGPHEKRKSMRAGPSAQSADVRLRKLGSVHENSLPLEKTQYDLIVLDLPRKKAQPTLDRDFYRECASRLTRDGLLSVQIASALPNHDHLIAMLSMLSEEFDVVRPYLAPVPQKGGLWMMACASHMQDPILASANMVETRLRERGVRGLLYYNGRTHQASMALPNFVRCAVARTGARWL
jgi:spermidine synthase